MKLIYQAKNITEAHIVSGLLNSHDIETYVGGHYLQGGIGELAVTDFANVQVADKDVLLAKSIISTYEGEQKVPQKSQTIKTSTLLSQLFIALLTTLLILTIYYFLSS